MNREEAKTSAQTDRDEIAKLRKRAHELRCDLMETIDREQRLTEILPLKEAFSVGKPIETLWHGIWSPISEPDFTSPPDYYRIVEEPPQKVRDLTPSDLPDHPWFRPRNGNPIQPMLIGETQVDFGGMICIRTFQHMRNEGWEFSTSHKGPWSKCEVSE